MTPREIYEKLVKEFLLDNFEVPMSEARSEYLMKQANIYAVQNTWRVYNEQT